MSRSFTKTAALIALFGALLAPAHPVSAGSSPRDLRAERLVREVLATSAARGTVPGIVLARGNDRLAARNLSRPFIPASLQKLATTSTALIKFGPDHRFVTRALVRAPSLVDGSVAQLVLVGGGDPTLATGSFRKRYFVRRRGMRPGERVFPSGSPTIGQLAARIQAAGVTRVRGNLIADETLFDTRRTQTGWKSSYLNRSTGGPYVGYLSSLIINQGYSNLEQTSITPSPALYTAERLRAALADLGIRVEGSVVVRPTPEGAEEVARVYSPPLEEIVGWINRWSANHPAELLLKGLGARFGGAGSTAAGRRVVIRTLSAMRVSLTDLRIEDGSGLSLSNRMTPRTLVGILRWSLYSSSAAASAMRVSLPMACRAGTLLTRMCDTRAEGNLRGKTGMVSNVRGMAGWVKGSDGVRTLYVAIFNRAPNESALTSTLNLLGVRLAHFR